MRTLLPILFLLVCFSTTAQRKDLPPNLYFDLGAGKDTHGTFSAASEVMVDGRYTIGFLFAYQAARTRNAPTDFTKYNEGFIFPATYPKDQSKIFAITYGRVFNLGEKPDRFRLNTRAGLAVGSYIEPQNFKFIPPSGGYFNLSDGYYEYDKKSDGLIGIVLKPTIEWTPASGFGMYTGLFSCINNHRSSYGAHFGIQFGRVKPRKTYFEKPELMKATN